MLLVMDGTLVLRLFHPGLILRARTAEALMVDGNPVFDDGVDVDGSGDDNDMSRSSSLVFVVENLAE